MSTMDDKVNYALVGAFVLALASVLVAAILWLVSGMGRGQTMDTYQAVIQESVAGLSVDAPVKYLGVDVGKVSRIGIDRHNSQQVRLRFLIKHGTPIKRDTVAVLKTQGLTGIAFVELSGGSAGSQPLLADKEGAIPTIPFKLSLSARLENVLTKVLTDLGHVTNSFNALLDADNLAALKSTLADTALLANSLAGQRDTIVAGLADAARTAKQTAVASEQIEPMLAGVEASAQSVEKMANAARSASDRIGITADSVTTSTQQLRSDTLPDLARLMNELNRLSASLRNLSEQTAASPSSVLMGNPTPIPGPGETSPP
jgi:phospholipid/cholesterol/gamma-HCH transport system substrate-binding protein